MRRRRCLSSEKLFSISIEMYNFVVTFSFDNPSSTKVRICAGIEVNFLIKGTTIDRRFGRRLPTGRESVSTRLVLKKMGLILNDVHRF